MALHHAASGEKIALKRTETEIAHFTSVALARTEQMELIRLVLPKDRPLPEHKVDGEMTLLCLAGEIVLGAHGRETILHPAEMVYLAARVPHTVRANVDAVALLTILKPANPAPGA